MGEGRGRLLSFSTLSGAGKGAFLSFSTNAVPVSQMDDRSSVAVSKSTAIKFIRIKQQSSHKCAYRLTIPESRQCGITLV